MKNTFFLIVGLFLILGSIFLFFSRQVVRPLPTENVKIGNTNFKVEIASTGAEREQGLSGRETLDEGTGMLFIFETPGIYGFWMKDMNFPIDIVWISAEKVVIGVERMVSPDTYPTIFYPTEAVKYVLELPAGAAEKYGVDIGQIMSPEAQSTQS